MTRDDIVKLKYIDSNSFLHTWYYNVPICIQTFMQHLIAIEYAPNSQNLILFDYATVIEFGITNELRPANVICNVLNRVLRLREPNVQQHDLYELTIEQANSIISSNIAAFTKFNIYVNEIVAINQINKIC